MKWGVNFCYNVREIKYYFHIRGIRKKRKRDAQKKGGENSPISPPLDPRLIPKSLLIHVDDSLTILEDIE